MAYISPMIKPQFDTLEDDLKNEIMASNVSIKNLGDLVKCLEGIVDNGGIQEQ